MKITRAAALAIVAVATAVSLFGDWRLAAQSAASPDQMVASLKTNLQESQKRLRTYQWIETTVISLKGEEKSRKQQQVSYGADGKLTKTPMGGAPQAQQQPSRGGRGGRLKERVVENKKDEMQDYMERAAALIQRYVPPSPELIQKAKDGGHVKLQPPNQGRVRVELSEFVQPGDLLAIDVDAAASQLAGVSVKTYLDKPEEAVTLDVRYATLTDGTSYISQTTLNAAAKNIIVVVQNSGHKPLAAR